MATLIRSPNKWSCLACCYGMVLNVSLDDIVRFVKHDGSYTIWPDLEDPFCRRGFCEAELVYFSLSKRVSPTILYREVGIRSKHGKAWHLPGLEDWFDNFVGWTTTDTFIAKVPGHAVVVSGNKVFDPAVGEYGREKLDFSKIVEVTMFTPWTM